MTDLDCRAVQPALSARADGEPTPIPERDLEAHLAACDACRREAAEILEVAGRLDAARRLRPDPPDLWSSIGRRLARRRLRAASFATAATLLVACRVLETLPPGAFAIGLKLLPVAATALLLLALRGNPARLPTELTPLAPLEGRTRP